MTERAEAAERLVDIKQKILLSVAKRADEAEAKIEQFDRMQEFIRHLADEVKIYLESEE